MAEVRVVALITTNPGQGDALVQLWGPLSKQVHEEDGCLVYDLHRVLDDPDRFAVLERWASAEALAAHAASPHMQQFRLDREPLLVGEPQVIVLEDVPAA